jgi:Flp pilus assembly protein TadG
MRGTALLEFALAWPIALLLALGCVELALWAVESDAARNAALAGARAAAVSGADPRAGEQVALRAMGPSLAGASAVAWCPGSLPPPPRVWVCVRDLTSAVEVIVGGSVPALVPVLGSQGLPLRADVVLSKERFAT